MGKSNLLGAWGEALAAEYLRKKRYKILASGYRCRFGEIDLIAASRTYLVFVEVKLRKSADFAQAREFVDLKKQIEFLFHLDSFREYIVGGDSYSF